MIKEILTNFYKYISKNPHMFTNLFNIFLESYTGD